MPDEVAGIFKCVVLQRDYADITSRNLSGIFEAIKGSSSKRLILTAGALVRDVVVTVSVRHHQHRLKLRPAEHRTFSSATESIFVPLKPNVRGGIRLRYEKLCDFDYGD